MPCSWKNVKATDLGRLGGMGHAGGNIALDINYLG
jgi:hypothetical protein